MLLLIVSYVLHYLQSRKARSAARTWTGNADIEIEKKCNSDPEILQKILS